MDPTLAAVCAFGCAVAVVFVVNLVWDWVCE